MRNLETTNNLSFLDEAPHSQSLIDSIPKESDVLLSRKGSAGTRFESMMESTRRRAYSMAFQLTHNPSEAEDLVQETYVKAWKGFDSYLPERSFLNWLLRIMQRAYLDTRRRDNPIRKAESLNSMVSPGDGEVQELPIADNGPGPDEELVHSEFQREVQESLAELPDVYRSAIVMCDLDGMSYVEIAEVQSTTVGTVRSRIHRGRRLLRDIVQKKGSALRWLQA